MCGRYTQTLDLAALLARFGASAPASEPPAWRRFNIAPSQQAPVIIHEAGRRLESLRWGLIPPWAKDPRIGSKLINARAETLLQKPSFKRPFLKTRCLVPADGFYEWKRTLGAGLKTPLRFVLRSGEPFAMAGLWDAWRDAEGRAVRSFAIITTAANELMRPVHDRMPLILPREHEAAWLDPAADPAALTRLLEPSAAPDMSATEVSTLVNSPKNDLPACLEPAGP